MKEWWRLGALTSLGEAYCIIDTVKHYHVQYKCLKCSLCHCINFWTVTVILILSRLLWSWWNLFDSCGFLLKVQGLSLSTAGSYNALAVKLKLSCHNLFDSSNLCLILWCECCISPSSAGIGRTGALITIDVAMGLMERDLSVRQLYCKCFITWFLFHLAVC